MAAYGADSVRRWRMSLGGKGLSDKVRACICFENRVVLKESLVSLSDLMTSSSKMVLMSPVVGFAGVFFLGVASAGC